MYERWLRSPIFHEQLTGATVVLSAAIGRRVEVWRRHPPQQRFMYVARWGRGGVALSSGVGKPRSDSAVAPLTKVHAEAIRWGVLPCAGRLADARDRRRV